MGMGKPNPPSDLESAAFYDFSPSQRVDSAGQILDQPSFRPLVPGEVAARTGSLRRSVQRPEAPAKIVAPSQPRGRRNWVALALLLGFSASMGATVKALYLAYQGDRSVIQRAADDARTKVSAVLGEASLAGHGLRASAAAIIAPMLSLASAVEHEPERPPFVEVEATVSASPVDFVLSPVARGQPVAAVQSDEPRTAKPEAAKPQNPSDPRRSDFPRGDLQDDARRDSPRSMVPSSVAPESEPRPLPRAAVPPSALSPPTPAEPPSVPAVARPAAVRIDPAEAARLRARGDELLRRRDVVEARLFFMRAAEGDDAASALALGKTFDIAFLSRMGAVGINGDRAQAAFWYVRARDLGNREADLLLRTLPPD
jgi:hypothetical protein